MTNEFEYADDIGPAKITYIYEPSVGLKAILVVDNVAMGPSIGGLRLATDVSTEECFRLARAMTLKNAAAEIPHGGGKSVMFGDPKMPKKDKEEMIRCLAMALRGEESYIFGPDMGTNEECMAWVHDEIGRSVGLPREIGGIPLDEIGATGWGLANATLVTLDFLGLRLEGARFAVQGFGAVGTHTARFLSEMGAVLVAAADSKGTIHNPDGLDVEELIGFKRGGGSVSEYAKGDALDREAIIDIECDIWIPAARPNAIREDNVGRLRTKLVISGANIPTTPAADRAMAERGILCVPDFISNAGGVICAAMEYQGATEAEAMGVIEEKLRRNTRLVLEDSANRKILPREAAVELATERVRKAMGVRRFSLFSSAPGSV